MVKKILGFIGSAVMWAAIFTLVETVLMVYLLTPILLVIPQGFRQTAVSTSVKVARWFADTSELTLKAGATCNQAGEQCLPSFIMEGPIGAGDGKKFESALRGLQAANGAIDLVCLNSTGGSNEEAGYIAGVIRAKKLKTCVGDMPVAADAPKFEGMRYTASCESACTIILLAGHERIAIGDRFVLGLHSARGNIEVGNDRQQSSNAAAPSSSTPANFTSEATMLDSLRSYKGRLEVSDEQLKAVMEATSRTPGGRMYFTSRDEQMKLGFSRSASKSHRGATIHSRV